MILRNSPDLWIVPLLITVCFLCLPAQAQYGGGTGEPNDPYLIYSAEQMNEIGANQDDWDKHFKLMADIDLSSYTETDFNIIGSDNNNPFEGVFDGDGHTISNFSYASTDTDFIGIFGAIRRSNSLITNLRLIDPNVDVGISDMSYQGRLIGPLAGNLYSGSITNCHVDGGSISGRERIGGLVGSFNGGSITNCTSSTSVSGIHHLGGLIGYNEGGTVANCYSSGDVSGSRTERGDRNFGGLVGENNGTISCCSSTGSVSGFGDVGGLVGKNRHLGTIICSETNSTVTGEESVGGLTGNNDNKIAYCYSRGSVVGNTEVGGLVGNNGGGRITNCYSTANVSGTRYFGGLVGSNESNIGEVLFSFWDIETSGQISSGSGTGMTTAEMLDPNTFMVSGWDFIDKPDGPSDIWAEPFGGGYPILWWKLPELPELPGFSGGTGEPNDPYIVSTAYDLNNIGHNPRLMKAHFKLVNDVDIGGIYFYIIGNEVFPFNGVFDGYGYTISNFSHTSTFYRTKDIGLFGYVGGSAAKIMDLGLIAPNINGRSNVGTLVGQLIFGTVIGCNVEGGIVSGRDNISGLVGYNGGTITNCFTQDVSVIGTGSGVGGLVGRNIRIITNCFANCSVLGETNIGGLVGTLTAGTVAKCYSTGSVLGDDNVGGLVGTHTYGRIVDCYSTSSVIGIEHTGGLVGSVIGDSAHNSFWDVQASGQTTSAGGKGRTTAQMHMASNFFGWNGIWTIDDGNDYPRLWWENKPGEELETQELSALLTGTGTEEKPYLIYTAEELNMIGLFRYESNKYFKLMSDIDLSDYEGTEFNIIGIFTPFTGVFDGNGKKILNLNLNHARGFFVSAGGIIKDLGLINVNVDSGNGFRVGSLVGNLHNGTVTNCYAEGGSVSGNKDIGGLMGAISNGTINNCHATISVTGTGENVGGLVGYLSAGMMTNCYATGNITGTDRYIGGLVGTISWGSTITDCYATGTVTGTEWYVGGLAGTLNNGTMTNCYSSGSVSGNNNVGGLLGENCSTSTIDKCYSISNVSSNYNVGGLIGRNGAIITNCYATGSVLISDTAWRPGVGGGLVGENSWDGTIDKCYSAGSVSAYSTELQPGVGGLVGENNRGEVINSFWDTQTSGQETSSGGMGKTTAEMQMESTFTDAGWDFMAESPNGSESIWRINEGVDYPRLVWKIITGDFDDDSKVGFVDFAIFAQSWLITDSNLLYRDGGPDLNNDGEINFKDLREFTENWLQPLQTVSPQPSVRPQPSVPPQPPFPPPPKGRGCFIDDTLVWVDGAFVKISKAVAGQIVGRIHCGPITHRLGQIETVQEHEGTFECRDVLLESGNYISVVDAHCFMLESGRWIIAQDLRNGLQLKTISGTVGIKSVTTRAALLLAKCTT